MGGSQAKAHLFIAVENTTVSAGQEISCVVHLLLNEPLKSPVLDITFTGKESAKFQADGQRQVKQKIIEFTRSLLSPNTQELQPGSYSFPFSIETPKAIPGTFKANMTKFQAKIQYTLKVELKKKKEVIGKNKCEVFIEQTFDQNRYSVLTSHVGNIVCCDCFGRGNCNITAHIDKNAYLPQETAKLWIEIDNSESRRTLLGIEVSFWRVIRLVSREGEVGLFKKCIFSTNVATNIASGRKLITGKEINIDIPIYSKDLEMDQCATTLGRAVQCRYYIEVASSFGRCTSRGVDFEVPIIISPKIMPPQMPSAPEDWAPMEMPAIKMSASSSILDSFEQEH